MTVTFNKVTRGNIGLLLMVAGGTGSGKTWSAMELAKGMALGKRFAVCDTERGRAAIYADQFDFDGFELDAPFTPERYLEVVLEAERLGYPVLVIDSMSHEWEGVGGLLDWHEQEMGGNQAKNLSAWIKPKGAHRAFVNRTLQAKPHIIMCFRAAEKVEAVRVNGKMEIKPKQSLTGLDGWLPITEKNLPYEATASFMLIADRPGLPHAIKLPDPLRPLIPLDRPLSAETGTALARWAAGAKPSDIGYSVMAAGRMELAMDRIFGGRKFSSPTEELLALADQLGAGDKTATMVAEHKASHDADEHDRWLAQQVVNARDALALRKSAA